MESNVRSYCRTFTDTFNRAKGSQLFTEKGTEFIDFFSGAGALNYGHNNDFLKQKIIDYVSSDGIIHGLDMFTMAKGEFLQTFSEIILTPRNLNYKVQFCGPTGTNAVEAALKLARKEKNRNNVFAFMGAFHGMSLGSLAATSSISKRNGAGQPLQNVTFMPFPYGFFETFDSIEYIESVLIDDHSGIDKPAAIIVETTQAEGGVVVAPTEWLVRLRELCDRFDILLICDDIQVGCYRTGTFFSFERAAIVPDMVILSKSISGYGLPMSLLLMKPELDIWKPAEHNGTFRGNQLAFVGAKAALEFSKLINIEVELRNKENYIKDFLHMHIAPIDKNIKIRGIGLIWGIDLSKVCVPGLANKLINKCYDLGLIIETSGRNDSVVKILPPLTIEMDLLATGCSIIRKGLLSALID